MTTVEIYYFFIVPATTEIYPLSLDDALRIYGVGEVDAPAVAVVHVPHRRGDAPLGHHRVRLAEQRLAHHADAHPAGGRLRSEEHTSELQSRQYLVCRLLLEKHKNILRHVFL